ncbi:MAG: hypothetical protein K9H16_01080 [Bacteroidales bacterium]|nr:hypothetical protein [Bacteroidales bacterium]
MEHYYCIDLSFPIIDFDQYFLKSDKTPSVMHSHLYLRENEIELRILFNPPTHFDYKFSTWLSSINSKKLGEYIHVSSVSPNQVLLNVSFAGSQLIGATSGSAQYEGDLQYYSIKLNTVKLYLQPIKEKLNTGDFYLSPNSFKVVSGFYSTLFQNNDCFEIRRYKDKDDFYSIESATFRPEFEFGYSDSVKKDTATIKKTPKIHFNYNETNEEKCFQYSETVKYILSFYFHFEIEYFVAKLYFKEHTISIKSVYQDRNNDKNSLGLSGFGNQWNLDAFLKADWAKKALSNQKKLFKAVELFNQSHLVDLSSRFLLRFTVLELCMGGFSQEKEKFTLLLSKKETNKKYKEALELLLKTVPIEERCDFAKKWNGTARNKLVYRPMKSTIETFLNSQSLPVNDFPITINELKETRDGLVHGYSDSVDSLTIEKHNIFLYRICGILILNLLGIKEWNLYTELIK